MSGRVDRETGQPPIVERGLEGFYIDRQGLLAGFLMWQGKALLPEDLLKVDYYIKACKTGLIERKR